MPDIRSFFGPKGGGVPAKPAPKKPEEPAKNRRSKGRKVLDDSDEDDVVELDPKKTTPKQTPRKKMKDAAIVKGVATTASDYFASSRSKPPSTEAKAQPTKQVEVRSSPRNKQPLPRDTSAPSKPSSGHIRKSSSISHNKHDIDNDEDAYVDDEEDGDDIFAAEVKGRNKRKYDDYFEVDSEEDLQPQVKRIAPHGRPSKSKDNTKPVVTKPVNGTPVSKKRKSPEEDSDVEHISEEAAPRKKPAPSKPRAPRAKKVADDGESSEIQSILDSVQTIRPPTPPPKDPNAKFDWRKAAGGGGHSGPPPEAGAAEIPEGQENCLAGMTFVFTGLLKTIGRDEAQNLVKRYGGRVTGLPSSKTSFVVLGDDAGPSKLAKIRDHGIKTIDENGLFDLIRKLPANGGSGKAAEKVRQKQADDQAKIKQQAAEMEREEKAKQAEADKARKTASARGAAPAVQQPTNSRLWTTKYAPTQLTQICGNKANVEKIHSWLKNWQKAKQYDFQKRGADGLGGYRAVMISGPPGIGKTTAAHLVAKLEGYDVLESNASDTRSKKLIEAGVSDVLNNTSLLGYFAGDGKKVDTGKRQIVLIMDEVDGMSAGDRGGVGALAKFCKKTEVPLILICNERKLPKMKPFDYVTFDIKFTRPTVDQIRSRIMTIAHREGLKLPPTVIDALIEGSNKDIRQIINMISTAKLDQTSMSYDQSKSMSKAWEKHVVLKPWDICQKMLSGGLFAPASKSTLNDKIELYFNDHEFSFLMIQENYLRTKPMALTGKGYNRREENLKHLELVDQAAESISDGDLVDRMIHGPQQQWSLMPTHAVFSTVRPSSFVAGQLMGSVFTSWLGNNSKTGRLGRLIREIHSHMRLKASGDHNQIRQEYLPVLWYQLIARMSAEGRDAVEDVIDLMDSYYLTRDDFDAIKELGVGPQDEERISIETQTKAAFTRQYNAMSHPIPFMKASNVQVPARAAKEAPDLEEAIEEEDEADVAEPAEADDDDLDLKDDKYIKKPKAKKATKKSAKAKDDDAGDVDSESKPAKGKAKGKTGAAKGKGKR